MVSTAGPLAASFQPRVVQPKRRQSSGLVVQLSPRERRTTREPTAQVHRPAKARAASLAARAPAVRMPLRPPLPAPQDHEGVTDHVTDRLVDGLQQVAGPRVAGVAAAVGLHVDQDVRAGDRDVQDGQGPFAQEHTPSAPTSSSAQMRARAWTTRYRSGSVTRECSSSRGDSRPGCGSGHEGRPRRS
jgi:hypothetical protein